MLGSSKLETLVFFVRNLAHTVAFYRDVLGLEVACGDGHAGPFASAQAGAVSLVFLERDVRVGESPVPVFSISSGIDDCADRLLAHGVDIVVPTSEAPDGGWTLDFLDPDGVVLSLHQPGGAPRRSVPAE